MRSDSEPAFAKINLALHVRHRRSDGYHELESLFAFVDRGDRLHAQLADDLSLTIEGENGSVLALEPDNLVMQAARQLRDAHGVKAGAALRLEKHLPVAAGLGGGSADAAAALRLLARLWKLPVDWPAAAPSFASLGADVPACIISETRVGRGVGEQLAPLDDEDWRGMSVLLVNTRKMLPTGPVFKGWDGVDRGPIPEGTMSRIALAGRNDLQAPAIAQCPAIAEVLDELKNYEAQLVRMSGSGATCFAIFEDQRQCDAADLSLRQRRPDWWTMTGKLL